MKRYPYWLITRRVAYGGEHPTRPTHEKTCREAQFERVLHPSRFMKHSIVEIRNKDDLCCAHAIVTMKARADWKVIEKKGPLFHFRLQPIGRRRRWRDNVDHTQYHAHLEQMRDATSWTTSASTSWRLCTGPFGPTRSPKVTVPIELIPQLANGPLRVIINKCPHWLTVP